LRKKGLALTRGLNRQLAQQGVPKGILEQYPFTVRSVTPVRGVWRLDTNRGPVCLKRTTYDGNKLKFIFSAMEHLMTHGFSRLCLPIQTTGGDSFVNAGDSCYFAMPWLRGRETDFKVGWQGILAARTLAYLHLSSQGFDPGLRGMRDYLGTWPQRWSKALAELKLFRDAARQKIIKTGFDQKFLSIVGYYLELGERALGLLQEAGYQQLVEKARQQKIFCHRDFTYHNLIINRYRQIYVLDFDYCAFDNKEGDLARFIRKVMEKNRWSWEKAIPLLREYEQVMPLATGERMLVLAGLTFPQIFWRLAGRYYNEPGSQVEEDMLAGLYGLEQDRITRGEFLERLRWEWLE